MAKTKQEKRLGATGVEPDYETPRPSRLIYASLPCDSTIDVHGYQARINNCDHCEGCGKYVNYKLFAQTFMEPFPVGFYIMWINKHGLIKNKARYDYNLQVCRSCAKMLVENSDFEICNNVTRNMIYK